MTLLPNEATFPALGTSAVLLTSIPQTLLPAVELIRAELGAFGEDDAISAHPLLNDFLGEMADGVDATGTPQPLAEFEARSRVAQRLADLLAEEFPGGFLVDLGGAPAVAGETLADELTDTELSELFDLLHAA